MNVLISGSNGFIGKKLLNFLNNLNQSINKIYILERSKVPNSIISNLIFETVNLSNIHKRKLNIDAIIHLASKAHIKNFTNDDASYSLSLTKALVSFAILNKVPKFIYFSSIKVYGENNHKDNIFNETNNVIPTCNYSRSKHENENEIIKSFLEYKISYFILRLPLVIGEGAKGNLNIMMKFIQKKIPLPLKKIDNNRSILSMTNLLYAVKNVLTNNKIQSGVFNICDSKSISTSQLVNLIQKNLNSKTRIFYLNKSIIKFLLFLIGKQDDYSKLFLSQIMSNSKSKEKYIFKDFINTKDEIRNMVIEYKKHHG